MNKLSQKSIILKVLENSFDFVPSYKLEKENTLWGWIGTSGSRRARELAEEGKIETKYEGGYVWYKLRRESSQQVLI